MKKRVFLFFLILTAAVAAAFAFVGCKKTEKARTKNEYVVFDDGCGKTYTLRGGEDITVYYEYDPEKELKFSETYYDMDTGKVTKTYAGYPARSCGSPGVYHYNFNMQTEGHGNNSYLTLIISAQAVSAQINEHGLSVFDWLTEGVGADYSFIAEMTGKYTVTCELEDENDEVAFDISDQNGKVVGDGILNRGWKYYVHVRVKSHDGGTVGVTTSVAFTPDEVETGENTVTRTSDLYIWAFTPEEDGVYTVEGENWLCAILDGETYETIKPLWVQDAVLYEGKKYLIESFYAGGNSEVAFTVKHTDREFAADTENELLNTATYAFTAQTKCNYKLSAKLSHSAVAELTVYTYKGYEKYVKEFEDECEFDLLLDEGVYYINVSKDCVANCVAAPKEFFNDTSLYSGEMALFTAPFTCKYEFGLEYTETASVNIKVTDADGNDVKDEKLTAGEVYTVYAYFDSSNTLSFDADPIVEGEFTHNRTIENIVEDAPYTFTPTISGVYRFTGASGLKVFTYFNFSTPLETDGDKVALQKDFEYYIAVEAETLTYGKNVTVRFYPQEIPTDGVTSVYSGGYMRFDLPFDDEVTLSLQFKQKLNYKIMDADFNEIQTGELVGEGTTTSLITLNLEAGRYYLDCDYSYAKVKFAEAPLGCGGVYTIEEGNKYFGSNTEYGYRFAGGLGLKEFTVTIHGGYAIVNYCPLKDIIKVFYSDGGTERSLVIKNLTYDRWYGDLTITFEALQEVGEYFIRFMPEFGNYEFYVSDLTPA